MMTPIAFALDKQRIASRLSLDPPPSLASLLSLACRLFSISTVSFSLAYEDEDQDTISLRSDGDVREALLSFNQRCMSPVILILTAKGNGGRRMMKQNAMKNAEMQQFLEDLFKFNHYDIQKVSKKMQIALRSGEKREHVHRLVQLFCSSIDRLANGQVVAWLDEMVEEQQTCLQVNDDFTSVIHSISQVSMLNETQEEKGEQAVDQVEETIPPPISGFVPISRPQTNQNISSIKFNADDTHIHLVASSIDLSVKTTTIAKVDKESQGKGDDEFQLVDGFKISLLNQNGFEIQGHVGESHNLSIEWRNVGQAITLGMSVQVKRLSGVVGLPTIVFTPGCLTNDTEGIGIGQKSSFTIPFQLPQMPGTSHSRFQVMLDMGSSLRHDWIPISDPFTVSCTAHDSPSFAATQEEFEAVVHQEPNLTTSGSSEQNAERSDAGWELNRRQSSLPLLSPESSTFTTLTPNSIIAASVPSRFSSEIPESVSSSESRVSTESSVTSGSSGATLSQLIAYKSPPSPHRDILPSFGTGVELVEDFQVEEEYLSSSLHTTKESEATSLGEQSKTMVSSEVMEHQDSLDMEESLKKLAEMGFVDKNHNLSLLLQYKDYHRVVQHLLQESLDQWTVLENADEFTETESKD